MFVMCQLSYIHWDRKKLFVAFVRIEMKILWLLSEEILVFAGSHRSTQLFPRHRRVSHFVQFYFFTKLNFFLIHLEKFLFFCFYLILFDFNPKSILIGANIKRGRESKRQIFSCSQKHFSYLAKKEKIQTSIVQKFHEFLSET